MTLHLPAELQALCDLNTLKLESGTFVEDDLRQYASDILWSMKTTTGDDGYIHLLLEHQSSADKNMAFRQLRYAVAAMQRHLEAGHKRLPLVIPVLFYHGSRSPYPFSTNWLDCFSNPEQAGKVYTRGFPLVDVTVIDDDEIMNHRRQRRSCFTETGNRRTVISTIISSRIPVFISRNGNLGLNSSGQQSASIPRASSTGIRRTGRGGRAGALGCFTGWVSFSSHCRRHSSSAAFSASF